MIYRFSQLQPWDPDRNTIDLRPAKEPLSAGTEKDSDFVRDCRRSQILNPLDLRAGRNEHRSSAPPGPTLSFAEGENHDISETARPTTFLHSKSVELRCIVNYRCTKLESDFAERVPRKWETEQRTCEKNGGACLKGSPERIEIR
jgi:hypothetical protein